LQAHIAILVATGITAVLLTAVPAKLSAAPAEPSDEVRAQIAEGKQLFVTSCASCHGATGGGAIAPAIAGRNVSLDVIRTTIANGRTGTPMPPFKDAFDAKSLAALAAFALSLSSNGREPTALVPVEASANKADASKPVAVGTEQGVPARGAALFFDPTRINSCRMCHSFNNKGGFVGPDLSTLDRTNVQILESLTHAKQMSAAFPATKFKFTDGSELVGVKGEGNANSAVIYDISSLPPVKRTVPKSEIRESTDIAGSGIYDHTGLKLSHQDVLDLSAYLGKP
jgi:ubiquinol-cytochrome c reductase cytochrome c subunit